MNTIWDSNTLKKITDAEFNLSWKATGLEIDSRKVKKGDLFCAIKGNNFDGHDFISGALKKGAVACLISKKNNQISKAAYSKVKNVTKALEKMGLYARKRSKARFIAITGSVGKTGTKEIFKTGLKSIADTFVNEKSYNNHLGVPLTLSRIPKSASYCVLEIGMNKKGEIKKLSKMVRPELAVITAIENSHLQGLKNLRNIALAKSEILDYLPKSGCIVFNKDTNYSELIEKKILKLSIKTKISYGREAKSDIKLMNYKLDGSQYMINASCFGKKLSWKMPAIGEHWIINSLALIGVGKYYDLDIDKSSECIDVVIDSVQHFLCTYLDESNLGILDFSYDDQNRPIYLDYYVLEQGVVSDEIYVDLDIDAFSIYLSSNAGVYHANKDSNLKQPESWELYNDNLPILSSVSLSNIYVFSASPDNTINIFNVDGTLIQNLSYSSDTYVDVINIEDIIAEDEYITFLDTTTLAITSYSSSKASPTRAEPAAPLARPTRRFVSPAMAETITATPPVLVLACSATRSATWLMRSRSATDVPPNFITMGDIGFVRYNLYGSDDLEWDHSTGSCMG